MEKFKVVSGVAAPLMQANVDTDLIIPKDFLKTTTRTGLGKHLFNDLRYDRKGKPTADFILNKEPFNKANILLAGTNFGCGSSREHAPWALLDFGIKVVMAPSFADIFYNNCFKNGILPVTLPLKDIQALADVADTHSVTVDLEKQTVLAGNLSFTFEIDPVRKKTLLLGLDDIGLTLEQQETISSFEKARQQKQPWLQK